jgi:glycosyltransferase involved in cell wall biosynthesis
MQILAVLPSERKKLLINCSNLHGGGAVAVASSFIAQLSLIDSFPFEVTLLISSQVKKNLCLLKINFHKFCGMYVKDVYGFQLFSRNLPVIVNNYDAVFTVFGPAYFMIQHDCHIMGLANPYLVYQKNPISSNLNFFSCIAHKIKCFIQLSFFSRSTALIVELDNIKKELELRLDFKLPNIYVVSSAVDEIYFTSNKWKTIPKSKEFNINRLKFGVIAKNYSHKNLKIFPFIRSVLEEKYGIKSEFYVTLDAHEWASMPVFFKNNIRNIGPLSLNECPEFYKHLDAVVFPTVLECFSAVPLEAMLMKKPLFTSDLPFIHDVCGVHCNYFDPFSADSIAKKIFDFYSLSVNKKLAFVERAYEYALTFPNARSRANSYLNVIQDVLIKNERGR